VGSVLIALPPELAACAFSFLCARDVVACETVVALCGDAAKRSELESVATALTLAWRDVYANRWVHTHLRARYQHRFAEHCQALVFNGDADDDDDDDDDGDGDSDAGMLYLPTGDVDWRRAYELRHQGELSNIPTRQKAKRPDPWKSTGKGKGRGGDGAFKAAKARKLKHGAPKQALTAYFIYLQMERALVRAKQPLVSHKELARLLGERWRALTGAAKTRYLNLAAVEKSRYHTSKGAWLKARGVKHVVQKKKRVPPSASPFS
jgi:hypothetical protein